MNRDSGASGAVMSVKITCRTCRTNKEDLGILHAFPNLASQSALMEEDSKKVYWPKQEWREPCALLDFLAASPVVPLLRSASTGAAREN